MIVTRVRGKEVHTLVDSGASLNMAGPRLFEVIPGLREQLQPCNEKVRAVTINGDILVYPAYIDFIIKINGKSIPIHALYSPKVNYELILGFHFLQEHSFMLDFEKMKLKLPKTGIIRATSEIILEPRSETVAMGNMKEDLGRGDGMVHTHGTLQKMNLLVANSIIGLGKSVPVKILNGSNTTKIIKPGTRLARVSRLGVCDLMHPVADGDYDDSLMNSNRGYHRADVSKSIEVMNPDQVSSSSSIQNSTLPATKMPRAEYNKMFKLEESEFGSTQKKDLLDLLWEFNDIFAKPGQPLGCADAFEFKIKLIEGAKEFKAKPYRSTQKLDGKLRAR